MSHPGYGVVSKQSWRKHVSQLKNDLSQQAWRAGSTQIHKRLLQHPVWKQADHIALYYSVHKEVDTLALIRAGWEQGKQVYLPKCDPRKRVMTFYKVRNFQQVEVAYAGLYEPIPERTTQLALDQLQLIIVPGIVFDHFGYRIGYGGGYYDRFLASLPTPSDVHRLSLAFHFQVLKERALPREQHDQPVQYIMTEQKTIVTRAKENMSSLEK